MRRAFANRNEQLAVRRALLQLLRTGEADGALSRVRQALEPFAEAGSELATLALTVNPEAVELRDWEDLGSRIELVEAERQPITAIGIDLSWPGHQSLTPDTDGKLEPVLETNYYADFDEVRFSSATRTEILAGYSDSRAGSVWQGNFEEVEIWVLAQGLGSLYGAIQPAARKGDSDDAEGDLFVLASCAAAIIMHLAVRHAIRTRGLPRPMAVLVGSNEDFPFFDAPVMSVDESAPFVRVFEQQEALRRAKMDASFAKAQASREQENAARTRFDPFEAMEHFGEAAKAGQDILKLMRKEKDIFLGIGVVGLAIVAQHLRSRK